jgi:hypothetical protein
VIVAIGLVALLSAAHSAPATAGLRQTVLHGQTDQNQPMLLRLVRSQRLLGFRIQYLVLDCRGPGSGGPSPGVDVLRGQRLFRYDRRGRLSTRYSTHRFERSFDGDLLDFERHIGTRVMFRGALGRHGSASGSFRVLTRV